MSDTEQIEQWEDPPEDVPMAGSSGRNRYAEVIKGLRENKGKWAKLAPRSSVQSARSLAGNILHGRIGSFTPAGAFEAKHSGVDVWVRFLGNEGAAHRAPVTGVDAQTTKLVRAWAQANDIRVAPKGNVPGHLVAQWRQARRGQYEGDGNE